MIFGDYKFLNELKINGEETDDVEDYTSEKMPEDDEVSEEETNDEEESEDGEEESNDLEDFTQEDFEDDEPEGGEESNDEPEENSDESGEETNNEEESEDLEDFTQEDFDSEDAETNEDNNPADNEESNDESEDTNNEDTENDTEENIDNVNNTLKDMEKDLFSDLTTQQMAVKNSELLTNYIDLYDTLVLLATSVSKINKTNDNIKVIELISDSLDNLKEMVNYVITKTYVTRTYIENLTNYKKSLVILQQINTMLKTLIVKKEKN